MPLGLRHAVLAASGVGAGAVARQHRARALHPVPLATADRPRAARLAIPARSCASSSQFAALTLGELRAQRRERVASTRASSAEILFDMRLALFRQLQRLSPRFYARHAARPDRVAHQRATSARSSASPPRSRWRGWATCIFLVGSVVILLRLDRVLFARQLRDPARSRSGRSCAIARGSRPRSPACATGAPTSAASSSRRCSDEGSSSLQRAGARGAALPRAQRRVHRRADVDAANSHTCRAACPGSCCRRAAAPCFSSAACA